MFKVWYKKDGHWVLMITCNDMYNAVLNHSVLRKMGFETSGVDNPNES